MSDITKMTKDQYESIVYVSCNWDSSCEWSKLLFEELLHNLREKFPTYLFISPVHAEYGADNDYIKKYRLFLLENCADEMWYIGEGTDFNDMLNTEICYCKENGIICKNIREVIK